MITLKKYINEEELLFEFDRSNISLDFFIPLTTELVSPITGKKHFIPDGFFGDFAINDSLYKYSSPSNRYMDLLGLKSGLYKLKFSDDFGYLLDNQGNEVDFYIYQVSNLYLDMRKQKQIGQIFLKALQDFSFRIEYIIDSDFDNIIDSDFDNIEDTN